jgi:hypothetical protein
MIASIAVSGVQSSGAIWRRPVEDAHGRDTHHQLVLSIYRVEVRRRVVVVEDPYEDPVEL